MKIMGIDYGRKKLGLALAETSCKLAEPLFTLPALGFIDGVIRLISQYEVKKIIVGNPGGSMEKEIIEFGKRLEDKIGLKVEFFDETLTTADAQKILIETGRKRKARGEKEDAIAAAIMLELYLEGGINNV